MMRLSMGWPRLTAAPRLPPRRSPSRLSSARPLVASRELWHCQQTLSTGRTCTSKKSVVFCWALSSHGTVKTNPIARYNNRNIRGLLTYYIRQAVGSDRRFQNTYLRANCSSLMVLAEVTLPNVAAFRGSEAGVFQLG